MRARGGLTPHARYRSLGVVKEGVRPLAAAAAVLGSLVAVAAPLAAGPPAVAPRGADGPLEDPSSAPGGPLASAAARSRVDVGGHPRSVVPFTPSPDQRPATRRDRLPRFWANGRSCSTGCRAAGAKTGWPLKPFHRQHALRAGINERRTGSMHSGIDIQALDGQSVYALQSGRAHIEGRGGVDERVQVGNFIYWHIRTAVAEGQYVSRYSTRVGRVLYPAKHLHLSEVRGGPEAFVNPLRPGGRVLGPWKDTIGPVIGDPELFGDGSVRVRVYDPQSFTVQTSYPTPVLAPAALAYRVFARNGRTAVGLTWALRGTHVYPFNLVNRIYGPGARGGGWVCFGFHPRCTPNWNYRLAGGLAPKLRLRRGIYTLAIYAWDWKGHTSVREVRFAAT